MAFNPDLFLSALNLAADAHAAQNDPGTGHPYVTHAVKVAMEVLSACAADPALDADLAVCCALLHDTVEDTPLSIGDVRARFGAPVADGVLALTKDEKLPKEARTADSLSRIQAQPREVWCVKLADRITNLEVAPPYWSSERRASYAQEARTILDALGAASPALAHRLADKIARYGESSGPPSA